MEKLNIIGSPIREPQNNKPRIFANVTGELSKKTLPSLAPRDYKGYAIKRVIGELYKGKDPSSLLTYIPRINPIDRTRNPKAYLQKKARIVERIVTWRTKQAVLRMADEIVNGSPDYKLQTRYNLTDRDSNIKKLVEANTPVNLLQEKGLDGSPIRHYIQLQVKDEGENYTFFDGHAIIKISERKNILLTKVQSRDLTRKEYISGGDYNITISGKIVSPYQDVYPTKEVMDLIKILKHKDVITCQSPYLDMFEISTILILSYDLPQAIGFSNVQNYTINAVFERNTEALKFEEKEKQEILSAKQVMQEEIAKREAWLAANPEQVVSKASLKDYLRKFNPKQFIQLQNWI